MTRLTGQIEELVNRQDVLEREMNLFREDVEFQLRERAGGDPVLEQTTPEEPPETILEQPEVTLPSGDPAAQYDFAFSQFEHVAVG